ncbi:MAG: STAS domain-containing protein [Planctomycetota bacterium]
MNASTNPRLETAARPGHPSAAGAPTSCVASAAVDLTSDRELCDLRRSLESALFNGDATLHVDLSSVRECNMGVIAMLVWCLAIAQQRSRRLVLSASPVVEKWLEHSRVSMLFPRFRTTSAAA